MASTASGLGASQAGAPGGPPGRELPGRRAIRTFLDKMKVEFAVIGVVIVYMVLVFADLMLNEEDGIPWWNPVFQVVDLGFLIAFTLELLVRLYAYGLVYVKDALNMFDAIVVLVSLVLQIFFMLQPEQVVVYGDCAVNPDPDAETLAEIALQSSRSAEAFGIEPCVAMISYSTGDSGTGADVDKVREATRIAKERAPHLAIDGPLQYDAAAIESVGKQKAPDSPVAGKATVFVFPDLNTGNTTYKAVQRSARVISVGPMLQGLNKPVNDLSRGALVDDIVYTIALTAIQASQRES